MWETVKELQAALVRWGYNITVDGDLGSKTETAIVKFQKDNHLYTDGIAGPITWSLLDTAQETWHNVQKRLKFQKLKCDKFNGKGANVTYLREDSAIRFQSVCNELHAHGAIITSAGGRRLLSSAAGPNRSKTSLHYLGIAHDLSPRTGMVHPETDPYVITLSDEKRRRWHVYARAKEGIDRTLKAWKYDRKVKWVTDTFVCLTEVFEKNGFKPISARKSFFTGKNRGGAEWWHFQDETSLVPDETKFGDELLKSFRLSKLKSYSVWDRRNATWQRDWF